MKKIFIAFLLIISILLVSCSPNGQITDDGAATNGEGVTTLDDGATTAGEDGAADDDGATTDGASTDDDTDITTDDDTDITTDDDTDVTTDDDTDVTTDDDTDVTTDDDTDVTTDDDTDVTTDGDTDVTTEPEYDTDDSDKHSDEDNNGYCDDCGTYVLVTVDFYSINDLHGKLEDSDSQPGVDELTSYLKNRKNIDDHTVFLSAGDMWQGGIASNGTGGNIITDWMNHLGFDAMALGNHEFDWGEDAIRDNVAIAEFPILAINIYDNTTGRQVDYCKSSVMIERGGAKIGIIGAIGNCYNDISSLMTKNVNFKTGSALTSLVKAESEKLRAAGADIIVYLIHDGTTYNNINVSDYYDISLSSGGYVDVVFGAHTHSYYITRDSYGVPHLQGGGDNSKGMTHVEVKINYANGELTFTATDYVDHYACSSYADDPIVQELLNKYWSEIGWMYDDLGYNSSYRSSTYIGNLAAQLYYEAGVAKWGDKYNIVLAGGSIKTREPYDLSAGYVQYGDLQMILPFDNPLYLCSIKGSDLLSRFINNSSYSKYYTISLSQISSSATYYIIADSWTAFYDYARCTPIEIYDGNTFARDLIAQYIMDGGLE